MYEHHFNFSEKPFSLLPDPDFLYLGEQHKMALYMLRYGVTNQAGFIVVTGEVGCGKTILVRQLLNELEDDCSIGLISDTHHNEDEVLQRVLMAFGLEFADTNRTVLYARLVDFLIAEYSHNRRVLLIVDEAQNMSRKNLEELRTLSNVNADKHQLMQLMLLGQPELRETLRQRDMRQFAQRISVDYHLEPLSEQQTGDYISHRLEVAGGDPAVFTDPACAAIYRNSGGVPRLINRLCDTALLYAYGAYVTKVDRDLVSRVASDISKGGLSGLHDLPASIVDYPSPPASESANLGDTKSSDSSPLCPEDSDECLKVKALSREGRSRPSSESARGPVMLEESVRSEMAAGLSATHSEEIRAGDVLGSGGGLAMCSSPGDQASLIPQNNPKTHGGADTRGHGRQTRLHDPVAPLQRATPTAKLDMRPTQPGLAPAPTGPDLGVSDPSERKQIVSSRVLIGASIVLFFIVILVLGVYERAMRAAVEVAEQYGVALRDDGPATEEQPIGVNTNAQAERARQWYVRAQDHLRAGEFRVGLESAERGLLLIPNNLELVDLRAQLEESLRQQQQRQTRLLKQAREVVALVSVARELLEAGDLAGVRAAVDRGLALAPDNAELLALHEQLTTALEEQARASEAARMRQVEVAQFVEKARAEQNRGEIDEALVSVNQGLAIAPEDAELVELGESLKAGIRERERRASEKARHAREIAALFMKAGDLSESGDYEGARAAVDRGLAIESDHDELLALGERMDRAIAERAAAEARRRQEAVTRYIQQARAQQSRGETAQALMSVRQGRELDLENGELNTLEAELSEELAERKRREAVAARRQRELSTLTEEARQLLVSGDLEDAQERIAQGLALDSGHEQLLTLQSEVKTAVAQREEVARLTAVARSQQQAGELEAGLESIERAVALAPGDSELVELSESLKASIRERERERVEEARRAMEVAALVISANERSGSKDYEGARAAIDRGLAIDPDNADLLALSGQIDAAIAEQERAAAEALRRQEAVTRYIQQARAQQSRGETAQALMSVRQGMELDPEHGELNTLEAELSEELAERKRREAVAARRQRELAKMIAEARRLQLAGEIRKARSKLETALELSPNNEALLTLKRQIESVSVPEEPHFASPYIDKGNRYLGLGDVASARLFYEAAVASGDNRGLLLIGVTYDPVTAREKRLRVHTDPVSAARWYRKALSEGVSGAREHLRLLASWYRSYEDKLTPQQRKELEKLLGR